MPKFQTYERQQGLGGGGTASYASDGAFGAPARAIAGLGNTLADVGDQFQAAQEKIRATQDEAWFSKARAETTVNMIGAEREAQQSATGEAASYMNDIGGRFTTYRDVKLKEAPSPRAQQLYTQWADSFGVGVTERASRFQAESELAKRSGDFSSAMNAHAQTIFADPTQYDAVYKRAMDDFEGAKQWMTPEQETKAREVVDRDLKLARARALPPDQLLAELGPAGNRSSSGRKTGSVVDRIIGVESTNDPNAQNRRSSAAGLGQFINSTWVQTVRKYRPDIARGASNDQIIELKTDAGLAREMTVRLTEENAAGLRAAGMPDTDRNIYLAHFAGLNGAKKILSASDDVPIASVMSADEIAANPFLSGKSVGDVKAWAADKMGSTGGGSRSPVPNVQFIDSTGGKIRDKPVQGWVRDGLARAAAATDSRIAIKIVSGGQNPLGVGGKRTGSTRHDHGNAADIVLVVDGKEVLPSQDKALYARFFRNAAAAGFKGLGHYEWGIHIGGGAQAVWGPDRSSKTLDPEFAKAAAEGWANPVSDGASEDGIDETPSSFAGNPYYAGLSVDEIMGLQSEAQRTVNQRSSAEYAYIKDSVSEGIARGTITSEAQVFSSGLKGGDLQTSVNQLRTAQEQGRNLTAAWGSYQDGSLQLNSFESKDRSVIDRMDESLSRSISEGTGPAGASQSSAPVANGSLGALLPSAGMSPAVGAGGQAPATGGGVGASIQGSGPTAPAVALGNVQTAWREDVVRRYGIVPEGLMKDIRRGIESRDPAEVAVAARSAQRVASIDPAALGKREGGNEAQTAADKFSYYTNTLGLEPEPAAQRLIDARDPEKARSREALIKSEETKKFIKDTSTEANVRDIFDPGIFGVDPKLGENPAQAAAMVGEYRDILEESMFDANGDRNAAKDLAARRFARIYRPSDFTFNTGVVSRIPPEATYPAGRDGTYEYIRQQAIDALKEEGVETEKIYLQPYEDTETDRRAGRPARYQLWYEKDGEIEMFNYPFSASPEAALSLDENRSRWEGNKANPGATGKPSASRYIKQGLGAAQELLRRGGEDAPQPDRDRSLDNFLDADPLTGGN